MVTTKAARQYKRVSETKRVQIIPLGRQQFTLEEIAKKTKVKNYTVRAIILDKWETSHHTRFSQDG